MIDSALYQDHPRSRGVYLCEDIEAMGMLGSSPLARGLRRLRAALHAGPGIIPARAGFTSRRLPEQTRRSDHPRSRGVYAPPASSMAVVTGSSPLARGLRRLSGPRAPARRIIPARAGFTSCSARTTTPPWDHPRSRGVYVIGCSPSKVRQGSSPLARGLRSEPPRSASRRGIIPARAGFTAAALNAVAAALGSSPLARGLHGRIGLEPKERRIIPARAGFTAMKRALAAEFADHPRSRGVYRLARCPFGHLTGSSPLARGLRPGRPGREVPGRIIPARAGFTCRRPACSPARSDHPRSRGVYS